MARRGGVGRGERGLHRQTLTPQFLHAGADRVEIVGGAGLCRHRWVFTYAAALRPAMRPKTPPAISPVPLA